MSAAYLLPRPPRPDFFKVRQEAPRLLTPLRRTLRHAYVRASDRGWFGLVPLRGHIVVCGFPRSGTTMLHLMLKTSVADSKSFRKERSAVSVAKYTWPGRHSFLISKKPSDIFRVDEIREYYSKLQANVSFVLNVRDPRSVLTSVYAARDMAEARPGYVLSSERWRAIYDHIQYQRQFDDVIVTEYRDLVERPGDVQQSIAAFVGCEMHANFDAFHSSLQTEWDTRQLNGIRPLDPKTLTKWRAPKHRARIQQLLEEIPELPQRLIEMGYEKDSAWVDDYRSIPDSPIANRQ